MGLVVEGLMYVVASIVVPFVAIGLDHTTPATSNGEWVLLVLRNALIGFMFLVRLVNNQSVIREVRAIGIPMSPASPRPMSPLKGAGSSSSPSLKPSASAGAMHNSNSGSGNIGNGNSNTDAAARVLTYLNDEARQLRVAAVVAVTLYSAFALPWLWPFQPVVIGFIVGIAQRSNNAGLVILNANRAAGIPGEGSGPSRGAGGGAGGSSAGPQAAPAQIAPKPSSPQLHSGSSSNKAVVATAATAGTGTGSSNNRLSNRLDLTATFTAPSAHGSTFEHTFAESQAGQDVA